MKQCNHLKHIHVGRRYSAPIVRMRRKNDDNNGNNNMMMKSDGPHQSCLFAEINAHFKCTGTNNE